ncbi:hypothetical protein ANO14919_059800 [Xylariales sp. No.14919]|nr:hypothetical protein ANO14919_059800 [Xylariales sp. No.14919]
MHVFSVFSLAATLTSAAAIISQPKSCAAQLLAEIFILLDDEAA